MSTISIIVVVILVFIVLLLLLRVTYSFNETELAELRYKCIENDYNRFIEKHKEYYIYHAPRTIEECKDELRNAKLIEQMNLSNQSKSE